MTRIAHSIHHPDFTPHILHQFRHSALNIYRGKLHVNLSELLFLCQHFSFLDLYITLFISY